MQEILDWYHLKENLYKIQAPKKWMVDIEAELWYRQVKQAMTKLNNSKYVGVTPASSARFHTEKEKTLCNWLERVRYA